MPREYDPRRTAGVEPDPKLPVRAACDFHPIKEAVNLLYIIEAHGDFYLCRECFLWRRDAIAKAISPPHPVSERRSS